MNAYIITFFLLLPGQQKPYTLDPQVRTAAHSPAACQAHADKLAAEMAAREAAVLARNGGRIVGWCEAAQP